MSIDKNISTKSNTEPGEQTEEFQLYPSLCHSFPPVLPYGLLKEQV